MDMTLNQRRKTEGGFTLVELAIVMIIIGLLITGILKGQEMIGNAQVTATVAQIKGLDAATSTFRDMYDAMPGDMNNPNVRLPNCSANCAVAGDGNSRVATGASNSLGTTTSFGSEQRGFFTHLSAADLITGVSANPSDNSVNFGEDLPTTEVGSSGFVVGYTGNGTPPALRAPGLPMRAGHYLAIAPTPDTIGSASGQEAMTASQAARIDRKLDDGQPNSGVVRAAGAAGCAGGGRQGVYTERSTAADCNLYIRIQG